MTPAAPRHNDILIWLLALTAGATDAMTFLGLGGVFSSVMTANIVLLGISVGHDEGARAVHTAIAVAGFVVGVLAGNWLTRQVRRPVTGWPGRVTAALGIEAGVLALVAVGWEAQGGHPHGAVQMLLLTASALAMGIQSAAFLALDVPGVSTTYITGMLTSLLGDRPAANMSALVRRRVGLLALLIGGAAAAGAAFGGAPRVVPFIPLAALLCVVVAVLLGAGRGTAGGADEGVAAEGVAAKGGADEGRATGGDGATGGQ